MEAKELRIGNYFWSGYNCKINKLKGFIPEDSGYEIEKGVSLTGYLIEGCDKLIPWGSLDPIELTEEWLLKFGFFKRQDGHYNLFSHSEVDIIINKDLTHWSCDGICFSVNFFEYVHQLQNLYFALTGKELTLKK